MEKKEVNMIFKDDTKQLTDASKEAYIYKNTLFHLNECFKKIREAAKNAKYYIGYNINSIEYRNEIFIEIYIFMKDLGYDVILRDSKNNNLQYDAIIRIDNRKKIEQIVISWDE